MRLKTLHNYQIVNSVAENEFDRITELSSLICDMPISLGLADRYKAAVVQIRIYFVILGSTAMCDHVKILS